MLLQQTLLAAGTHEADWPELALLALLAGAVPLHSLEHGGGRLAAELGLHQDPIWGVSLAHVVLSGEAPVSVCFLLLALLMGGQALVLVHLLVDWLAAPIQQIGIQN